MVLTDKSRLEMNEKELLHYQIMETMAIAKGYSFVNSEASVDFRSTSSFYKVAAAILQNFDVLPKKRIEVVPVRTADEILEESKKSLEEGLDPDLNILTTAKAGRPGRKPKQPPTSKNG